MIYTEVQLGATCDNPKCGGVVNIMAPFSPDEKIEWELAEMLIEQCGWVVEGEETLCPLCRAGRVIE